MCASEVIGPGVKLNKSVSPDGAHGLIVQLLSQLRLHGSWLLWERDRNSEIHREVIHDLTILTLLCLLSLPNLVGFEVVSDANTVSESGLWARLSTGTHGPLDKEVGASSPTSYLKYDMKLYIFTYQQGRNLHPGEAYLPSPDLDAKALVGCLLRPCERPELLSNL